MNISYSKILKNKYLIALVIFLLIVLFIDDNNFIERFSLINEKSELKTQVEFYEHKIKESNRKLEELKTDSSSLEKFAREEYFMKKENEDIYIITDEKQSQD